MCVFMWITESFGQPLRNSFLVGKRHNVPAETWLATGNAERQRVAGLGRGAGELWFRIFESGDRGNQAAAPGNLGKGDRCASERGNADAGDRRIGAKNKMKKAPFRVC